MCVCGLRVQIRVDVLPVQNDCRVQEGNSVGGPFRCKLDSHVECVDLLEESLQLVLSPVPDGKDVIDVPPPYVWAGCRPGQ